MLESFTVGNGPLPMVLLHGFLGSGRNLGSLARRWSELDPTLRFVVPDLTGHGNSPPVGENADLRTLALDVLETVRALGITGPVSFTGHSLGGRVALAASLVESESVRDVTLLDIAPGPIAPANSDSAQILGHLVDAPDEASDRETMRQFLLSRGISRGIVEWLLTNLVHTDDGYVWRIDRHALARVHKGMNSMDLWPALERPGAKVRCIRGGRSRYVSDADKARMEAAGCPVATLPDAGHFVHVDAPKELLDLLVGRSAFA